MKIGCIIQARMTSSRLAGKVLLKLPLESEKTVLEQVITRLEKSVLIDEIIVATTINKTDDVIEEYIGEKGKKIFRGSEDNVLERFYLAAKEYDLDLIIRITSDCPCIDYKLIDEMIKEHIEKKVDYTTNALERTFPHGLDAEVFSFELLKEVYENASEKYEIEHVSPYIYKSNPEKYKINIVKYNKGENVKKIRVTLDTEDDYTLICAVYDYLYSETKDFDTDDIVKLFQEKKWLYNLNNKIIQKKVCSSEKDQLEEGIKILKKQDLEIASKILEERLNEI